MDNQNYLFEEIELQIGKKNISKIQIPEYITGNLKHSLWDWQKEALQYFFSFDSPEYEFEKPENGPTHLMFNMATGTGKTLLMAALILYYYKKGHRNFVFFVNQNNIVDKTENNLIDKNHNKYLFRQNIVIDDKNVGIRKVETFADNCKDIQIKFTSIHKLHNAVYLTKENSVYLGDLQKKDIIMLGDEAHHLNAETKKNSQMDRDFPRELKDNASDSDVEKSWENTVIKQILNKGQDKQELNNNNALLEFTATIPKDKRVVEKYRLKTIYKFELVDFLNAGYTKEINLISTSLDKKEKILLALVLNWYRHKIALKFNISNFKPIILFRSKFIEDSRKDFGNFLELIKNLKPQDFNFLKNVENSINEEKEDTDKTYGQGKSRIKELTQFINSEKVNIREIVAYIKYNFSERNCIITNSKDNKATTKEKTTEEQEKLLNSLEDKNNHIRAIFTVKRLTEGWDVLNLFDIVRLYTGSRDEYADKKTGKRIAGETTIQETQLIGRGVRYFPFAYGDNEKNKRKFDNDLENPLRVLEEFYYHSEDNPRYIDELKRELKNKGLIQDNRVIKKFALKEDFKGSLFYKEIKIWKNERIDNEERKKMTLSELKKEPPFEYKTTEFALKEQQIVLDKDKDKILAETIIKEKGTISKSLKDFEKHILKKAINKKTMKDFSILRFDNLRKEFDLESIDELFTDKFLGNFKINIVTTKDKKNLSNISHQEQLNLLLEFFGYFERKAKEIANPYKGTEKFNPFSFEELFGEPKEKNVLIDEESKRLEIELKRHKWYVLDGFNGTTEEKRLLESLMNKIGNLDEKYDEVYLLRNEEIYKIYDFEQGRGFEPDFLLFLKKKELSLYYQVFIEPKGEQFTDKEGKFEKSKEGWKEEFLEKIMKIYGGDKSFKYENKDYKLIGLPLFNYKEKKTFEKEFNDLLLNSQKDSP